MIAIAFKARKNRGRDLAGIKRIARPGLRVYARNRSPPKVLGGLGVAMISTSQGLMTGPRPSASGSAAKSSPSCGRI